MAAKKLSVFLLMRSLETGGAERQLVLLAKGLKERGHDVEVGLFYSGGALAAELVDAAIGIVDLRKRGRWDLFFFVARLIRELRRRRPDILYSFLGTANMMATAARPFLRKTPIVWSIRASNMDLSVYDWPHLMSYKIERWLSNSPDLIIANSSAGSSFAVRNGFPAEKIVVIPNGIDTMRFRPDTQLRRASRARFGLRDEDIAVGVLARLDPMKGQEVFLRAASIAATSAPKLRFLCIGDGPDRQRLEQLANELKLRGRLMFTGVQDPVAALNALDIACSCSPWGEGFSNAIAEAMACGLPCVVTDVGDSAQIVGSCGKVVQPGSAQELARALVGQAASLDRHDPTLPRTRIVDNFSPALMIDRTLKAFQSLLREGC